VKEEVKEIRAEDQKQKCHSARVIYGLSVTHYIGSIEMTRVIASESSSSG
jgi:hypothetical protein